MLHLIQTRAVLSAGERVSSEGFCSEEASPPTRSKERARLVFDSARVALPGEESLQPLSAQHENQIGRGARLFCNPKMIMS